MIKVTFEGVEYTKASHVAKKFGYTADYIGQLCRAKKINARLVGRSWFVNVPSLELHREGRYKKPAVTEVTSETTKKVIETEEVVGAEASQVTIKKAGTASKRYLRRVSAPTARLHKVTEIPTKSGTGVRHASVRYESDDNSLLPKVINSPKVTLLKVDIAGSEPLAVKSVAKTGNTLVPEPLPDVALSGALTVSEIPDGEYSNEESDEDSVEPTEFATDTEIKSVKRDKSKNIAENDITTESVDEKKSLPNDSESVSVKVSEQEVQENDTAKVSRVHSKKRTKVTLKMQRAVDFAPMKPDSAEIPVANLNPSPQIIPIQVRAPAIGLVMGVVVATLVLSAEQVGLVSAETVDFAIKFDWSNVSNIALVLFTG